MPYVFTEYGILMLANILKSEKAVMISIRLIEIFVKLRQQLASNKSILKKVEELELMVSDHGNDIKLIFSAVKHLLQPGKPERVRIGYRRESDSD